jgi:hypothetical protein
MKKSNSNAGFQMQKTKGASRAGRKYLGLRITVLGACWGTEELGWNERSRKQLRDVRQQSNGFENYEL